MHEYDEGELRKVLENLEVSIETIEHIINYPLRVIELGQPPLDDIIKEYGRKYPYSYKKYKIYYNDWVCRSCDHRMNYSRPYQCGQSGFWLAGSGWGLSCEHMSFDEETQKCSKYEPRRSWYERFTEKIKRIFS